MRRNFSNLLKVTKGIVVERKGNCKDPIFDKELCEVVWSYLVSDIKASAAAWNPDMEQYRNFTHCVWNLQKMGTAYFKEVHKRFRLMQSITRCCSTEHPGLVFDFYFLYWQYVNTCNKVTEKFGTSKGLFEEHIPNNVIMCGLDHMRMYIDDVDRKTSQFAYENKVAALGKKYKVFERQYSYNGEDYICVIPKHAVDICQESHYMRNCMSARMGEYSNKSWFYAFIRRADMPDEPFIDAIISTGNFETSRIGFKPMWVITKNHVDVKGTENEGVFDAWFSMVQDDMAKMFKKAPLSA